MKKKKFIPLLLLIIIFILLLVFKPSALTYKDYRYFSKMNITSVYSKNGKFLGVKKECAFSLISRCNLKNVVELEKS